MRLAALAASAGVQIIMETHSDHIINGALVAMKKNVLKKRLLVKMIQVILTIVFLTVLLR